MEEKPIEIKIEDLKPEEKEEVKKKIILDAFPEDPADGDNVCISCQ